MKGGDVITALYILLGIIVIVALLLSINVSLHIIYKDDLNIYLKVLFIKHNIFPEKKKKFNKKDFSKKEKGKKSSSDIVITEKSKKEKKPSLVDKISYIKEILSVFLKAFSKYLKIDLKTLHIVIASPDAAQTAITYGAISGIMHRILPEKRLYIYCSLIIAMILGRIVWGIAMLMCMGISGGHFTFAAFFAGAITNAVPGIIVQIIFVPLIVSLKKRG